MFIFTKLQKKRVYLCLYYHQSVLYKKEEQWTSVHIPFWLLQFVQLLKNVMLCLMQSK